MTHNIGDSGHTTDHNTIEATQASHSTTIAALPATYETKVHAAGAYQPLGKTRFGLNTVLFGDSYMDTCYSVTGTPGLAGGVVSYPARGWFTWANFWLMGKLNLVGHKGATGEQTTQWAARYDTDVTPLNPHIVFMGSAGINDMGNGRTPAQVLATLQGMFDKNEKNNALTVMIGPVPLGSGATTAQKGFVAEMASLLRREQWARRGSLVVIDCHPALSDMTDADTWLGLPGATYTADGTHLGVFGAMRVGKLVADALAPLLPGGTLWPSGTASKYATTDINIIGNAGLTGTAGTASNGATGSVADGWTVGSQSGAALAGTACSKVARTDLRGGEWQRIVVTAGDDPYIGKTINSGFTVGKTYVMGWEINSTNYQPNGGVGALETRLIADITGPPAGGAFALGIAVSGIDETAGFASDLPLGHGIALTPPMTIDSTTWQLEPQVLLRGAGTVDLGAPFLIQID